MTSKRFLVLNPHHRFTLDLEFLFGIDKRTSLTRNTAKPMLKHAKSSSSSLNTDLILYWHLDWNRMLKVQTESQSKKLTLSTSTDAQPVNIWMEHAGRIATRLHRITGNNSIDFLHQVVDKYLKNQHKDSVYEHIVTVRKLQKSIYRFENEDNRQENRWRTTTHHCQ